MPEISVLVVDDEGELAYTLSERLELRGFSAEGATSGEEALERLGTRPVDVVVMDVKMPGLGGLETLRRIHDLRPGTPVILVTGHGCKASAEEGIKLGAFRYLMKPVQIEVLAALLSEAAATGRTS